MGMFDLKVLETEPATIINEADEKAPFGATITKDKEEYKVMFHKFLNIIKKVKKEDIDLD